jgi:rubrerythrin
MIPGVAHRRQFKNLSEQEVLALAISSEEDDPRIYRLYAQRLRADYPQTATVFDEMAGEEDTHRASLIEAHVRRFGEVIPLIRREHVAGFYTRRPVWLIQNLGPDRIREEAARMEIESREFYQRAAQRPFVLIWVQPGLAGLMDGSVSTLAPIFAAAFATGDTWQTFLVGLAASVGAGISMGFTEAASDDGTISGRGSPAKRGIASGLMTAVGGLGHALPYLIPDFWTATIIAMVVVFVELWTIAWVQNRYMETPFWRAALQVVAGGSLVFASGILIGSA